MPTDSNHMAGEDQRHRITGRGHHPQAVQRSGALGTSLKTISSDPHGLRLEKAGPSWPIHWPFRKGPSSMNKHHNDKMTARRSGAGFILEPIDPGQRSALPENGGTERLFHRLRQVVDRHTHQTAVKGRCRRQRPRRDFVWVRADLCSHLKKAGGVPRFKIQIRAQVSGIKGVLFF